MKRDNEAAESCGIGLKESQTDNPQSTEAVLQEAVDYLAGIFERDEAVDGATVVEWFAEWRRQAKRALSGRG